MAGDVPTGRGGVRGTLRGQPIPERGPPSPRVLKGGRSFFKSAGSIRADMALRAPMGSRQHVFTFGGQSNKPGECRRSQASDVL